MSDMNFDHQRTNPSQLPEDSQGGTVVGNQPPPGDTTSEGGYGGDPFSRRAQRGLVDQSLNGGPVGGELQDAKQGQDLGSREEYKHEQSRDAGSQGLNPYGQQTMESRKEAGERLASLFSDSRARQYESGPAVGNDQDVGA